MSWSHLDSLLSVSQCRLELEGEKWLSGGGAKSEQSDISHTYKMEEGESRNLMRGGRGKIGRSRTSRGLVT